MFAELEEISNSTRGLRWYVKVDWYEEPKRRYCLSLDEIGNVLAIGMAIMSYACG